MNESNGFEVMFFSENASNFIRQERNILIRRKRTSL